MAKHQQFNGGGLIIFDETDLTQGLVPQGQFGSSNIKQTKYAGLGGAVAVDPFRNIGILQPGMGAANATNASSLGGELLAGVFDPTAGVNNLIYGVDIGGKFQQINFITNTITNAGNYPWTIAGTTPIGQDCIIYQHNSGGTGTQVYSAFYSYYNTANWDVGALVNMTGTPDDDFMSSVPSSPLDISGGDGDSVYQKTAPHPMCVGSDDILYIGSGRYLHGYDGSNGANGTFISRVLTLPAGFQVQGMVKYNDSLYIAGNYATSSITGNIPSSGSSAIYIWDYLSQDITQIIPVNEPYIASIFIWRGAPAVVCYGPIERNGYVKIKRIIGNQAIKATDIPSSTTPVLRGIDSRENTLYMNIGGAIVTIGDRFSGEGYDINYIGYASVAQNSGWIYNLQLPNSISGLIVSSSNGSSHSFSKLTGGFTQSAAYTQFYEPDFPPLKYARVKMITVYFYQPVTLNVTNPQFSLRLATDYVSSVADVISASQSLSAPLIKKYMTYADGASYPYFTSLGLQFIWNGGSSVSVGTHQVSKVIVEYELKEFQN